MRKVAIILSLIVLIANSCGQTITTNEVTSETTSNPLEVSCGSGGSQSVNNQMFDILKIDSVKYFSLKNSVNTKKIELEKIDDLKQAKEILKGRVIWGKTDEETYELLKDEQGDMVFEILFRNGKIISYDYPEVSFIAYFPQEDILFLEGEHSSSMIYNLTTGEETEDVGDPEYRCFSPSKQYRFNGYYSGQADVYFIQEKSGTQYKTIIELDYSLGSELEKLIGFIPEYLSDVFWQNDTILNFIAPRYFYPEDKTEKFYYQLILK